MTAAKTVGAAETLDAGDDILFEPRGEVMVVTLNRPAALNALTLPMAQTFAPLLSDWAADDSIAAVVVQGAGERAFCAGGDIIDLYEGRSPGGNAFGAAFFAAEYRLNRAIKVFPKPYIALIDGIAMGGGVGLSVHGSHRVATERTLFAMPETGIGLFPDVGGSYFLPRLPGRLGLFLGLTGWRVRAADCLLCRIADAFVPSARLPALVEALVATDWRQADPRAAATAAIADHAGDPGEAALTPLRAAIDRCFAGPDLSAILAALTGEGADWSDKALALLGKASPTSLLLALEQLRRGAALDFDACMTMEYRLSQACLAGHDFYEGIRAAVVEKDQSPRWDPARIEDIQAAAIERAFAPRGDDLTFVA